MDDLQRKQRLLEETLGELKSSRSVMMAKLEELGSEIKEKVEHHNVLVASISNIKKEYKEKMQKFSTLRTLVKEYKRAQRTALEGEYEKEIRRIVNEINGLKFDLKVQIFRSFDTLQALDTSVFPILNAKKEEFRNLQRVHLKKRILSHIKEKMCDISALADLIFYINFAVKYEVHFCEEALVPFLAKKIEKEFEYHFLSDRPSNRLDKPEWFFDFLLKKYEESGSVMEIYSECAVKAGRRERSPTELVMKTQHLVLQKLSEIAKGGQQRNLIMNFISKYRDFAKKIEEKYSFTPGLEEISHVLATAQTNHVRAELAKIQELRYVQWFPEYKRLCRDALFYISRYGDVDKSFRLKDLIVQIISHARVFIENFRFINREEIKALCFLFSELEDLKAFIIEQEGETSGTYGIGASSVDKITIFNAELFKLIKNLATTDTENILRKLSYFTYTTKEVKRTVFVELNRVIDEYRTCVYSDLVEKTIQERVDQFLFDEILLKVKFSSDEYLEFRSFYRPLKAIFEGKTWKSDEACKCIDAIFERRTEPGELFKVLSLLYGHVQ